MACTIELDNLAELRLQRTTTRAAGLRPAPDNWRARLRAPDTRAHCPMVLHRGAHPDGS